MAPGILVVNKYLNADLILVYHFTVCVLGLAGICGGLRFEGRIQGWGYISERVSGTISKHVLMGFKMLVLKGFD